MQTEDTQNRGEENRRIECQRCGRDRPDRRERFRVILEDHSPSSAAYETFLLCAECWEQVQDRMRRCLA